MAVLSCPSCHEPNSPEATVCGCCGYFLADGPATSAERVPERGEQPGPAQRCPSCNADVPDPGNRVCVACLEELASAPPPADRTATGSGAPARTRREPGTGRRLLLRFADRTITVTGEPVLLGRDAASPAAVLLAAKDNVSRRHASVTVDPDGRAWVRDEYSVNGTFVNDGRLPPGGRHPLDDGDVLRMASDVTARIERG